MTFWIAAYGLALAVTAILLLALLRGRAAAGEADADRDLRVYRDQLREIDRDLARAVLEPGDAERLRTEVARRILEADRARQRRTATVKAPGWATGVVVMVAVALPAGALWIYDRIGAPGYQDLPLAVRIEAAAERRATRDGQAAAEAEFAAQMAANGLAPPVPQGDDAALVERLRALLANRPDDLRGHRLLAVSEARLGNWSAAHRAQARVLDLLGPDAAADEHLLLAEMMINAAGGYVSPEAEAALEAALRRDPRNLLARYFYGLMFAQIDRPDIAFEILRQVLAESDPSAPWVASIRAGIEPLAARAGVRYQLPPAGVMRGPTAAEIAAAMDMPEEARVDMIGAMVAGLASRLANEGGTAEDWARLISAYGVLGAREDAAAIWAEAQVVFGARPEALEIIRSAAEGAGVAQ